MSDGLNGNGSSSAPHRHAVMLNEHEDWLEHIERTVDAIAYNQSVTSAGQAQRDMMATETHARLERVEKQQGRVIELLERLVGDTVVTEIKAVKGRRK